MQLYPSVAAFCSAGRCYLRPTKQPSKHKSVRVSTRCVRALALSVPPNSLPHTRCWGGVLAFIRSCRGHPFTRHKKHNPSARLLLCIAVCSRWRPPFWEAAARPIRPRSIGRPSIHCFWLQQPSIQPMNPQHAKLAFSATACRAPLALWERCGTPPPPKRHLRCRSVAS